MGPYDILIAAQARRRGAVLVTSNGREFARVPGLRFEELGGSYLSEIPNSVGLALRKFLALLNSDPQSPN